MKYDYLYELAVRMARLKTQESDFDPEAEDCVVFVVDDNELVVRSICTLLNSQDIQTHGYSDPVEFTSNFFETRRCCIICDYKMPKMNGLQVQQHLIARGFRTPIILLSGKANVDMAVKAFSEGAAMVIEKPFKSEKLLAEVYKAFSISEDLWETKLAKERFKEVTPGELLVLKYLVAGKINKQIARLIGVSERTVERRKNQILQKTGTNSIVEAFDMARRAGIDLSISEEENPQNKSA